MTTLNLKDIEKRVRDATDQFVGDGYVDSSLLARLFADDLPYLLITAKELEQISALYLLWAARWKKRAMKAGWTEDDG